MAILVDTTTTFSDAVRAGDMLDADLAILQDQVAGLDLPPAAVALGAAELVEKVSEVKITARS